MKNQGTPFHGNFLPLNLLPPSTNATGSSNLASDVFSLKKYTSADIFISFSTHAGGGIFTLYKSSDLTTNSTQPIAFNYYYTTQLSDQFSTAYTATSTGVSLGTADNAIYHVPVNQEDFSSQLPNCYFTLTGSTGQSVAALGFLSGARYFREPMPTAIS